MLEGAASHCGSALGLSRLSPFFPSRPSTLHHSLQEEPGVSVSAPGPGEWDVLLVGYGCQQWVVSPLSPVTALLSCVLLFDLLSNFTWSTLLIAGAVV